MSTHHNSSTDTVGVDGLRREHEESAVSEVRIDVATNNVRKSSHCRRLSGLLAVPVARDDTGRDRLEQARHLPRSRSSLRMTEETLLRHNRDSVAWRAPDRGEDIVPNPGLVLLLDRNR